MATDDPMMASVAGRYASALFELATERGKQAAIEADLVKIQGMIDGSPDLARLVKSPVFSAEEQLRAISAVTEKAGIGGLAANFLGLIARNRRLFAAPDMIKAYRLLATRARGEVEAEVTSAVALTPDQLALLEQTLKASVGQKVAVSPRVDPALLGGLVVKIGSRMIDSSLRTKLDNLKIAMKEVG